MRFLKGCVVVMMSAAAGCRPGLQPKAARQLPVATPPVAIAFAQYSAGDTLDLLRAQLGLDYFPVRYRTGMPAGEMGMIYFLNEGNLHIDARQLGDTWVILSVPLLEPSKRSADDRVAEWDRGADPQRILTSGER